MSTNVRSQPGRVAGSTNTLLTRVSGNWTKMLARATGRNRDELELQVVAAALVWSLQAAIRHWHSEGQVVPLRDELEKAFAIVEGGLRIDR